MVSSRPLALLSACLLLAAPALAARQVSQSDWVPLAQGNRWSYRLSKESVFRLPGGQSQTSQISGADVEEVTRSLGPFAGARNAFEVVHRSEQNDPTGARSQNHTETLVVSADEGRLVMHTGESDGSPIKVERPVIMLPASPKPGQTWDAGAIVTSGLRFDMSGQVVGFEDVRTPAGDFAGCLKVRFTGKVSGSLDVGGGTKLGIQSAEIESFEWYAPGVGMVKEASKIRMSVRMPDGASVAAEENVERLLDGYSVGRPASQAP